MKIRIVGQDGLEKTVTTAVQPHWESPRPQLPLNQANPSASLDNSPAYTIQSQAYNTRNSLREMNQMIAAGASPQEIELNLTIRRIKNKLQELRDKIRRRTRKVSEAHKVDAESHSSNDYTGQPSKPVSSV